MPEIQHIFDLAESVRQGKEAPTVLNQYAGASVRAGGWNTPFITLTAVQQKNYLMRAQKEFK